MKALSSMPHIRTLELVGDIHESKEFQHALAQVSNLTSLSFRWLAMDPILQIVPGQIMAKSPNLQTLDIIPRTWSRRMAPLPFHSLFRRGRLGPPPLTRLTLMNQYTPLCADCVPFLRHLTDLELNDDTTLSAPPESFWLELSNYKVRLRRLSLHYLDLSVILYIGSYEGLEDLSLRSNFTNRLNDALVDLFHQLYRALPVHRSSLKSFVIDRAKNGPWSVTQANWASLSTMYHLEQLGLPYFPRIEGAPSDGPPLVPLVRVYPSFHENALILAFRVRYFSPHRSKCLSSASSRFTAAGCQVKVSRGGLISSESVHHHIHSLSLWSPQSNRHQLPHCLQRETSVSPLPLVRQRRTHRSGVLQSSSPARRRQEEDLEHLHLQMHRIQPKVRLDALGRWGSPLTLRSVIAERQ